MNLRTQMRTKVLTLTLVLGLLGAGAAWAGEPQLPTLPQTVA